MAIKDVFTPITHVPHERRPIGSRWVFSVKNDGRFKARLVAKGFTQIHGIDYNHTFAPVAKFATIRTMLAVATLKGWNTTQKDVGSAYLNADIKEEIYMEQPEGYVITQSGGQRLVCRLKKSLYGLKQAGRLE